MIFQDPASSLNRRATIADNCAEPLRLHRPLRGAALGRRITSLLEAAELPATLGDRYPHELSGGQQQRAVIARDRAGS